MLRSCLCLLLLVASLLTPRPTTAATPDPTALAASRPDFFGIVGRDPAFALTVGQRETATQVPVEFLDRMAADMATMGARWIRIEFHADSTGPSGPGAIDYSKYDIFIRQIAPRHGLKVLALLNSAVVTD